MKRFVTYCFLLAVGLLTACEDIYTPDIEERENVIVADARIVVGQEENYIRLNKSLGYNEKMTGYPPVLGGEVTIFDNNGGVYFLPEVDAGFFTVDFKLNPELEYRLEINSEGNTFESDFESVPEVPSLDTVYGIPETIVVQAGGENNINDFREREGVILYTDITSENEMPYYRFTARKVLQYGYIEGIGTPNEIYHYLWKSFLPQSTFNIASPPDYSNSENIIKHPLFFFDKSVHLEEDYFFSGWILILYQFGLSKPAFEYYNDLNNQLNSEGRIFDPLYVQARNNLKCSNKPEELILGNFEISTVTEYRYFIKFISNELGYKVEPSSNRTEIPWNGETIEEYPEFWEH